MLRAIFRRSFLIVFFVLFVFSFLVIWNKTIHDQVDSSFAKDDLNAQITELYLCIDPDINGKPNKKIDRLVVDYDSTNTIYVCGFLQSNTSKSLAIFWLKDDNHQSLIYSPKRDYITEPGFFYSPLQLAYSLSAGKYKVEIWDGHRKTLANIEFEVVENLP